jgi:hypothetical protein
MARNMCDSGIHEQLDAILEAITEGARKALDEVAPSVVDAIDDHMDEVRNEGHSEGREEAEGELCDNWFEGLPIGPDNTLTLAIADHNNETFTPLPCVRCGSGLELRGPTIICTKCRTVHKLGI